MRDKSVHVWVELTEDAFLAFANALTGDADDLVFHIERLMGEELGVVYPDLSVQVDRERVKQRALEIWGQRFVEKLQDGDLE